MPSKSPAQARLMRAVAHGWEKPGGGGPSKSVAKEFVRMDKSQGMSGMSHRQAMDKKYRTKNGGQLKGYSHENPGYKHRASASTVGGGGVGNVEYRHDPLNKSRNPQTRGSKNTGYATGHGSRNKQTPGNYYVQDGAMKMQKCMVDRMRSNSGRGSVSSKSFPGGGSNPYGGAY